MKKPFVVLGIYEVHNASACIMIDGEVVAASHEERFSKIKNEKHETNWIIGGERVYKEFIERYFNLLNEISDNYSYLNPANGLFDGGFFVQDVSPWSSAAFIKLALRNK